MCLCFRASRRRPARGGWRSAREPVLRRSQISTSRPRNACSASAESTSQVSNTRSSGASWLSLVKHESRTSRCRRAPSKLASWSSNSNPPSSIQRLKRRERSLSDSSFFDLDNPMAWSAERSAEDSWSLYQPIVVLAMKTRLGVAGLGGGALDSATRSASKDREQLSRIAVPAGTPSHRTRLRRNLEDDRAASAKYPDPIPNTPRALPRTAPRCLPSPCAPAWFFPCRPARDTRTIGLDCGQSANGSSARAVRPTHHRNPRASADVR